MTEIARMKLVPENMRAMCDWVIADPSISSHQFQIIDNMLEIGIDVGETHLTILHGQWLVKDKNGKFKVTDS